MVIKVGINSFGRIGRVIFRTCRENSEIEVSAINDPAIDLEYMCYLIKFDSTHGKYAGTVSYHGDEITINDSSVKVYHYKVPADIPWQQAGVQYVVEASGMFTNVEKASGHLTSGSVRRVIVTAPSADAPMLILGVNEDRIQPDVKVISCASSTLYCLAPIVKVLEDAFGVGEGFVTSIHAMTPSLKPLDGLCVRGKHWRDHRSIHQNIIPASTGACKALGKIIPSCKDKLAGLAFRVPIVNVSVLDMSIRLNKNTTITEISHTIEKLKNPALRSIIQVSNEKAVSSDFIGDKHSCTLDIDSSLQITPNFFKLICWYENEYSYSCRVVGAVLFSERQFQARIPPTITSRAYRKSISFKALGKLKLTESIETNVSQKCVPFQNRHTSNIKPGSLGFIMEPTTVCGSPIYIDQPIDSKKRVETIKAYIDRFIKCKCNTVKNKISIDPPAEGKERAKTQECLKKVEKEISEMLNMTENLLNKSANKNTFAAVRQVPKETTEKELALLRENIIAKISDTLNKIRKEKSVTSNIEICGDNKSLILDVDDYRDKTSTNEIDSLKNSSKTLKSNSSCKSQIENDDASNFLFKRSNIFLMKNYPSNPNDPNKFNVDHALTKSKKAYITDLKSKITKENESLVEGKTEDVKSSLSNDRTNVYENDDAENEVILIISENKLLDVNSQDNLNGSNTLIDKCNKESENINYKEQKINANNQHLYVKNIESQHVVPLETVMASALETNNHNKVEDQFAGHKTLEQNHKAIPGCSSNQKLGQKCFSNAIENLSEESLLCATSDYIVCNGGKEICDTYRDPQDIYDKLNSTSGSDSDSSYQIHKKTSQIINITDLTYSLGDLTQLDKLCRVIEISDDLSDRLFSSLDSENGKNTTGRKWSFQDLCERIKFDEFCKDLFEKSAS